MPRVYKLAMWLWTLASFNMHFSLVHACMFATAAMATTVPLERRKDFYTTHEEHGHLPGPRNPPPKKMFDQIKRVASFENPFKVLNTYNTEADQKKGARFGRKTKKAKKARYADALGLSDIPILNNF